MKKKIMILSVIYFLALILSIAIFPNIEAIKNCIANNTETVYEIKDCTLNNWTSNENGYVTGPDSQICFVYERGFANNIMLRTESLLPNQQIQVYYLSNLDEEYSEQRSMTIKPQKTIWGYMIPIKKEIAAIRIDLTEESGYEVNIDQIIVNPNKIEIVWMNAIPFVLGGIFVFVIRRKDYILKDIYLEKKLIFEMAKNDLKSRYAGSALGILWAYVQPILTIIVFWYVFQVGFKSSPVSDIEYILWFIAGYIPWMLFNDGLIHVTNALQEYSYLVKKIKFKISILPVIKLASSFFIHLFFILFIVVMYMVYGYFPQFIWLQALYYSFALMILLFGMGLIFSSLAVLFKDCSQVISVILQVLFWYTPVVWTIEAVGGNALIAFKINPLFYIINGYRETFISGIGYWEHPALNAYYWGVTFVVLLIGFILFDRFKPHFSDLL